MKAKGIICKGSGGIHAWRRNERWNSVPNNSAGGNLTGLLKMLAGTIRERLKMRLKIKAASSEGRASAIILTSAPICVFLLLQFASPHFYGDVINQRPVQLGLAGLGTWMLLGNLVMRKMIDMRI